MSILFFLISVNYFSQIKEFDKLEMLYDQQHYKSVYKKSIKFLNNPEYDFSLLPIYYKTLSALQMAKNEIWLKRNQEVIAESKKNFSQIKSSPDGEKIWNAHYYELVFFKRDMIQWLELLKQQKNEQLYQDINQLIIDYLIDLPDVEEESEKKVVKTLKEIEGENKMVSHSREKMSEIAIGCLGTPYLFNGQDLKGFDCSGFTSYIYQQQAIKIPRTAHEQFEKSVKLKENNLKKGDLIFFSNGSRVSHVGLVVSNKGEPVIMIHASSTKGIVVTELDKSSYWKNRIVGYGTFIGN